MNPSHRTSALATGGTHHADVRFGTRRAIERVIRFRCRFISANTCGGRKFLTRRALRERREVLLLRVGLCAPVVAALLLMSCGANNAPHRICVQVREDFKGKIHVSPCVAGNPATNVTANDSGVATISDCPHKGDPIEFLVMRAGKTYSVPSDKVVEQFTGDGIAVSIDAPTPEE
jgi:hypothetical protein